MVMRHLYVMCISLRRLYVRIYTIYRTGHQFGNTETKFTQTWLPRLLKYMVMRLLYIMCISIRRLYVRIYTIYRTGHQFGNTKTVKVIFWEFCHLLGTSNLDKHDCLDFWNKWSWGVCMLCTYYLECYKWKFIQFTALDIKLAIRRKCKN